MTLDRIKIIVVFLVSFILFYGQYQFYVPMSDDLFYQFIQGDIQVRYIQSFGDVLESMNYFYTHINGRYLVHVAVMICLTLMPLFVFLVVNSIFYACFVVLLLKYCFGNLGQISWNVIILVGVISTVFIPMQGLTFLGGIAPTVNYLLTAVFVLLFLILYDKYKKKNTIKRHTYVLLFIFSTLVGSLQESFTIGLAGAYFVYMIINRRIIKRQEIVMIVGLLLGTSLCVLAPGNFVRLGNTGLESGHAYFVLGCLASPGICFLFGTILYQYITKREFLFKSIKEHSIIAMTILFNAMFCVVIAYIGRHQLTAIAIFCLILTIKLLKEQIVRRTTWMHFTTLIVLIFFLSGYIYIYQLRKERFDAYNEFITQIQSNNGQLPYVSCSSLCNFNNKVDKNIILNGNYIGLIGYVGNNALKKYLSLALSKGNRDDLCKCVLPDTPDNISDKCIKANVKTESMYDIGNGYYVFRCNVKDKPNGVAIDARMKPKVFFFRDENIKLRPCEEFEYKGYYYYLFSPVRDILSIERVNLE